MEKLIILGTGNASVTKCYNTCFALQQDNQYILVDAGGGNGILRQLQEANIPLHRIKDLIVTHCHSDHVLGVIWVFRMIATSILNGKYDGVFTIYCHDQLTDAITTMVTLTLQKKLVDLIGTRIIIKTVEDMQVESIMEHSFTFFDIHSTKIKQFGFTLALKDGILTCLGDEPCHESCQKHVQNAKWLLSEAFCLYQERDIFKPYQKHHSTVKEASELASALGVENLVLYHSEEVNLKQRKELYTKEAKQYYQGNIFVPDDLEVLTL